MKKPNYETIKAAILSADILPQERVQRAVNSSRTMGRPLIPILIEETKGREETLDALRGVLSPLLEIPFFEDATALKVNMDLTRKAGLDGIEKTKTFFVEFNGTPYLHMLDPMSAEKSDEALTIAKNKSIEHCFLSTVAINTLMTRDISPILIAERAKTMVVDVGSVEEDAGEDENVTDVAKMFNDIISAGINSRASDVHLSPEKKKAMIRFRVDGILRDYMEIPLPALEKLYNYVVSQAKIPEPDKPKEPRDGSLEFQYSPTQRIPLRISTIEETEGRSDLCIRILSGQEMSLEALGMNREHQQIINRLFRMTKGVCLFVGPTGSGKSTSMYAGIRTTDYVHRRVMTCEDPVEQTMENILQVSVNEDAGMTYAEAIKSFLRHDPDIIVIGEIRDFEVGINAMRASETGHLVISTLHCNNAPAAIPRLTGLEIPAQSVATSLSAVIAQRLARRVCPNCKKMYPLPTDHPWRSKYRLGDGEIMLAKGEGCAQCEGSGYKGRIVLAEIMVCTREIRAAIERHAPSIEIEKLAAENGYRPLIEDGIEKARAGLTTFDEIDILANDIV